MNVESVESHASYAVNQATWLPTVQTKQKVNMDKTFVSDVVQLSITFISAKRILEMICHSQHVSSVNKRAICQVNVQTIQEVYTRTVAAVVSAARWNIIEEIAGVFDVAVAAQKCSANPTCTYFAMSTVAGLEGMMPNQANTAWLCRGEPTFAYHAGWVSGGRPQLMPPRFAVDASVNFDGPQL